MKPTIPQIGNVGAREINPLAKTPMAHYEQDMTMPPLLKRPKDGSMIWMSGLAATMLILLLLFTLVL